jgi:hypothetical protein
MASQTTYSFPVLMDRELLACLHELGMSATAEQLANPTFEFVQPVFENLVTALTGTTRCARGRGEPGARARLATRPARRRPDASPAAARPSSAL